LRVLIDTNVLIRALTDPDQLGEEFREWLKSQATTRVVVSDVSLWEIAIKLSIGKLRLPERFRALVDDGPFERLPITADHVWAVRSLPRDGHGDPFDRLLICQARLEGLVFATADRKLEQYGVPILRA
jgi:PIN domain nuclease of toxin-antitoxin system